MLVRRTQSLVASAEALDRIAAHQRLERLLVVAMYPAMREEAARKPVPLGVGAQCSWKGEAKEARALGMTRSTTPVKLYDFCRND